MNNSVMCETCAHASVCKHQTEFTEIQKQLDNFKVSIGDDDKAAVAPIKSFDYIEIPRLRCKDFLVTKVYISRREGVMHDEP